MNTYLLGLITKWASIAYCTVLGIFGFQDVTVVQNTNQTKNSATQIDKVAYEVVTKYNDKLPKDVTIKDNIPDGTEFVDEYGVKVSSSDGSIELELQEQEKS